MAEEILPQSLPMASPLFPWFGSKKDVAREIWDRLGDVPNFVDPCCGSLCRATFAPPSR